MLNRLIRLNKFPRKTIKDMCGTYPSEQTVICVGNTMERIKLEKLLLEHKPVILSGKGKLTAVLEICDRKDLNYHICYNGIPDWGNAPFGSDDIFIIRYDKVNKDLAKYVEAGCSIAILCDGKLPEYKCAKIVLAPLTPRDYEEYHRLKGFELSQSPKRIEEKPDKQLVNEALRTGIAPDSMPEWMDLWFIRNLYQSEAAIKICMKAQTAPNLLYKWGMLNLIRVKRPMDLKFPAWVKMK